VSKAGIVGYPLIKCFFEDFNADRASLSRVPMLFAACSRASRGRLAV
jgi:hypothetical protein